MESLTDRMVAEGFDEDTARAILCGFFQAIATREQLALLEERLSSRDWDFLKKS